MKRLLGLTLIVITIASLFLVPQVTASVMTTATASGAVITIYDLPSPTATPDLNATATASIILATAIPTSTPIPVTNTPLIRDDGGRCFLDLRRAHIYRSQ